ncbi:MAG TPA: hypothetical protein VG056_01055, partial [Pirellulales bacterium]|nr:hypothetical protein [Pirellulales bacterium]
MPTNFRRMTILSAILGLSPVGFAAAGADTPSANKSPVVAKNSLDDELLKSLDGNPLEKLDDRPAAPADKPTEKPSSDTTEKPVSKPAATKRKSFDRFEQELRKSLGGEDLGSAGEDLGQNQLTKISQEMRSVEERLAQSDSDPATRKQQAQIAAELAALIDQLQKQQASQCKSGSCDKPGGSGSKPGQPKQASGQSPATSASNRPPRDSSNDPRPNRSDRPDPRATRDLLSKILDGLSLPAKDRD